MDSCQEGKYKVWPLNKLVNVPNVVLFKISPSLCLLGFASRKHVEVHRLDYTKFSCEEALVYHVDFNVEDIKWSPDSKALLIMSQKDGLFVIVQLMSGGGHVFRVQEPKIIDLLTIEWVPDSKHVLSVSKHSVYAFAHSMINGQRILLPAISSSDDGRPLMAFSPDGKYLVLVNFSNSSFHATLISTSTWCALWKTKLQLLVIQGMEWCPKSNLLAVWDYSLTINFLELNGETCHSVEYSSIRRDGLIITMFNPHSDLFIGASFQDMEMKVLVYNLNTWRLSAVLDHPVDKRYAQDNLDAGIRQTLSHPFNVKSQLSISHCGGLLASSLVKGSVIVWNLKDGCRLVEVFKISFSYAGLKWHPKKPNLVLAIDNGEVFIWKHSQEGPIIRKACLESLHLNLGTASSISWSTRKLVFCSLNQPLFAVVSSRT